MSEPGLEDIDPADLDDLGELGGDEDGSDDDAGEYTPPSKDEWTKLQAKIKRQEGRITKLLGGKGKPAADIDRQLAAGLKSGKGTPAEDEGGDDSGEVTRWRTMAAQQSAATQLAAAGFQGSAKQSARLTRLLDLAGAEPDRHGAFDFEDEIEDLIEEFPQLFAKGAAGRPAPVVRRADSRSGAPAKDPTRETTDALLKSAGYK